MAREINTPQKIAILGAGLMGTGIAYVFAANRHSVQLYDISAERLDSAKENLQKIADVFRLAGRAEEQCEQANERIAMTPDLHAALSGANIVIEAVSELAEVKADVFRQVSERAPANAAVWSNTSSLDVFELAPEFLQSRLLIAHWFAPAHILPLVELVPGPHTQPHLIGEADALLATMGKIPVKLDRYVPGFIINRLLRALGREAFYLIDNGYVTAADLDRAVKASLAPRMMVLGVMQRYDFTGLDLSAQNFKNDKFVDAPVDLAPRVLVERVNRGELGVKTGRGFYDYQGMSVHEASKRRDELLLGVLDSCSRIVSTERSI